MTLQMGEINSAAKCVDDAICLEEELQSRHVVLREEVRLRRTCRVAAHFTKLRTSSRLLAWCLLTTSGHRPARVFDATADK